MVDNKTQGLFRKEAIQKATNSEQLDQPLTVVGPLGWLSLSIFFPIIVLALIWGFFGRIPTTVAGTGILLRGGVLHSVLAQAGGQVGELYVQIGDEVSTGQVVGVVKQPVLEKEIATQQLVVNQYEIQLSTLTSNQQTLVQDKINSIEAQKTSTQKMITDYKTRSETLQKIATAQQDLLAKGLITETVYFNSLTQLSDMEENIAKAGDTLLDLSAQESSIRDNSEQLIFQTRNTLLSERNQLEQLQSQMEQNSKLVSAYNGRVAGIETMPGQNVEINTPIIDLEVYDKEMTAVVYFPALQGKKILPSMPARVSPSTAEVEEYGYIEGTVSFVSELPASQQSMNALLRNADLTKGLSMNGAPIRVDVQLIRDQKTFSGFKWSSSKGPKIKVTPGTICTTQVVTLEQPPITLLVPLLKKFFGISG